MARIDGTDGDDRRNGTENADRIRGRDGNDTLNGLGGNDEIRGENGNDSVTGGKGNDDLRGDEGNDALYGGAGSDWLEGGRGNDLLFGGAGKDTFEFERGDGLDVIGDFANGIDRIKLDGFVRADVEALIETAEESNEGVTITLATGTEVTITGLTLAQLDIGDFNF